MHKEHVVQGLKAMFRIRHKEGSVMETNKAVGILIL
jgi:hypothetical protein